MFESEDGHVVVETIWPEVVNRVIAVDYEDDKMMLMILKLGWAMMTMMMSMMLMTMT